MFHENACTDSRHVFHRSNDGRCRRCGADAVDWTVTRSGRADYDAVARELQKERWRWKWFTKPLDAKALAGPLDNMARRSEKRLRASIGTAQPYLDGRQTPYEGNIIYYAQHALACC